MGEFVDPALDLLPVGPLAEEGDGGEPTAAYGQVVEVPLESAHHDERGDGLVVVGRGREGGHHPRLQRLVDHILLDYGSKLLRQPAQIDRSERERCHVHRQGLLPLVRNEEVP